MTGDVIRPAGFAAAPVLNPKTRGRPKGTASLAMARRRKEWDEFKRGKAVRPELSLAASILVQVEGLAFELVRRDSRYSSEQRVRAFDLMMRFRHDLEAVMPPR